MEQLQRFKSELIKVDIGTVTWSALDETLNKALASVGTGVDDALVTLANDVISICLQRLTQLTKRRPNDVGCLQTQVTQQLFERCFYYAASASSALANSFHQLLTKLVGYMVAQNQFSDVEHWVDKVCNTPALMKQSYITLEMLINSLPDKMYLIQHHHRWLINTISRMEAPEVATITHAMSRPVVAAYKLAASSVTDPEDWWRLWGDNVIPGILRSSPAITNITAKLVCIQHSKYCFDRLKEAVATSPNALISVLRLGQDAKIVTKTYTEVDEFILESMLIHADAYIRLGVLALVLGAPKKVKMSTVEDKIYDLLDSSFIVASFFDEYESIDIRQSFSAIFSQFLTTRHLETIKQFPDGRGMQWTRGLIQHIEFFLMPSSNYSEVTLALEVLYLIIVKLNCDSVNRSIFTNKKLGSSLVQCLFNDYENIRHEGKRVLLQFPKEEFKKLFPHSIANESVQSSILILQSLEGRKCDGAVNFLDFLNQMQNDPSITSGIINEITASMSSTAYVHGYFSALEVLLGQDVVVAPMIEMVQTAWNQHGAIICKDLADDDTVVDSIEYNYSWKLTKAANGLLVKLIPHMNDDELRWTVSLIEEQIGSIKHRGAFMSIYPSYISVISACLQSPSLEDLPYQRLEAHLEFTSRQGISRRSGGVPYLFTGVLTAANRQDWFQIVFERLFTAAKQPLKRVADAKYDTPQVHAFNIMKQIFSESVLAKQALPYAITALELSLEYFCHNNWSLRNCAVMLFGSVRQRLMVGKSWSSGTFFDRYSALEAAMHGYLSEAVSNSSSRVFPILILLGDLKPSLACPHLASFKPDILKLLASTEWKIRQLVGATLMKLYNQKDLEELLGQLSIRDADRNLVNGILLTLDQSEFKFTGVMTQNLQPLITSIFQNHPWANRYIFSKCLSRADLGVGEINILGNILAHFSQFDSCIGVEVLTLAEITRILLEYYHSHGDRENLVNVACLSLEMHFELQMVVFAFLEYHPQYGELALPVARLANGNWCYTRNNAQHCLAMILSQGAHFPLLSISEGPSRLLCWASTVTTGDFDRFLDECETAGDIEALRIFISRDLGRSTKQMVRGIILVALFGLFNEDESVRKASAQTIAKAMEFPSTNVNPAWMVKVLPVKLNHYFGSTTVSAWGLHYLVTFCRFVPPSKPHVLFGIERTNLYQNDLVLCEFLGQLLMEVEVTPTELSVDVTLACHFVERLGHDGMVGWLRLEYNFVPLFRLLYAAHYTDLDVSYLKQAMTVAKCTL